MINAAGNKSRLVYDALRKGRSYVIRGEHGHSDLSLKFLQIEGDTLRVELSKPAEIRFIGQGGLERERMKGSAHASLLLRNSDTYIRVEARDDQSIMVLNPVIRYNGTSLPVKTAEINRVLTILYRTVFLMVPLGIAFFALVFFLQRKRSTK